jgi:hypothetical protein
MAQEQPKHAAISRSEQLPEDGQIWPKQVVISTSEQMLEDGQI